MTPHQLFRETTVRPRSWPPYAWAIVAGAAAAMFIAVVLVAWEGAQMHRDHVHGTQTLQTVHLGAHEACR